MDSYSFFGSNADNCSKAEDRVTISDYKGSQHQGSPQNHKFFRCHGFDVKSRGNDYIGLKDPITFGVRSRRSSSNDIKERDITPEGKEIKCKSWTNSRGRGKGNSCIFGSPSPLTFCYCVDDGDGCTEGAINRNGEKWEKCKSPGEGKFLMKKSTSSLPVFVASSANEDAQLEFFYFPKKFIVP